MLLETAGKWQAFSSQQGRSKVCYALSKAEARLPANLKDVGAGPSVSSAPALEAGPTKPVASPFDTEAT